MANILIAPADTLPGPSNNHNAAMSMTTGAIIPVQSPTWGQVWPSGAVLDSLTPAAPVTYPRTTTTVTTASQAPAAGESGTVTLANGYRLLSVALNRPARIRLYTTTAYRDADVSRPVGTNPSGDHGVVLDFASAASLLSADLSPVVDGFDGKPTPDGVVAYRVDNRDAVSGVVSCVIEWVRTE